MRIGCALAIKIVASPQIGNVEADLLAGHTLLRNNVFYGINGSGKSTICEVISQLEQKDIESSGSDVRIFAFNTRWRESTIGPFLEGDVAQGVMTVQMSEDSEGVRSEIARLKKGIKRSEKNLATALQSLEDFKKVQADAIKSIADHTKVSVGDTCRPLMARSFNKKVIEKILNSSDSLVEIEQQSVKKKIDLVNSEQLILTPVPVLGEIWEMSDEIWAEVSNPSSVSLDSAIKFTEWVRNGLELHVHETECDFCGGEFSDSRREHLQAELDRLVAASSDRVREALRDCRQSQKQINDYLTKLGEIETNDTEFQEKLLTERRSVEDEGRKLLVYLDECQEILNDRCLDLRFIALKRPQYDIDEFKKKVCSLSQLAQRITTSIANLDSRKETAVVDLRKHYCSRFSAGWRTAKASSKRSEDRINQLRREISVAETKVSDLNASLSASEETAQFIDANLRVILGEHRLRIVSDSATNEYRIERMSKRADRLSEGERKLISLLYFCAEFRTEERKKEIQNSVILFDDLGSELDEVRLYAIDRFITDFFSKEVSSPESICYFTHSFAHFKILLDRLGSRAVSRVERGMSKTASAAFFEIYKEAEDEPTDKPTTKIQSWDEKALSLQSDYDLSFYLLVDSYKSGLEDEPLPLSIANDCRKVLEGFTEFKEPGHEKFGKRMEDLSNTYNVPVTPALSKIVNHGSHSSRGREAALFSRNLLERCVKDTILFVRNIDLEHFQKMFKKVGGDRSLEASIESLQAASLTTG